MRLFVKRLIVVVFVTGAIMVFLDLRITKNLQKSDTRLFQSWNDLFSGEMECDAVIMGSSRGFVQYSPLIIDSVLGTNCYNLGFDGRCIDAEIVKYYAYRQFNPKPKLIIQNVDYGTLGLSNGYEREQFLPYLWCDTLYELIKDGEGFSWKDRYLPLVRYSGYTQVIKEGLGLPNKLNRYPLVKGYYGRDEVWDGSVYQTIEEVPFCHDMEAVKMFDDYLSRCANEGVRVVFVFAPIYIGVTEKVKNVESVFDYYDSLASKYHIPILNYTYDSLSYDTTYFYNASHLNKSGAEIFSRHLAEDINRMQLLN